MWELSFIVGPSNLGTGRILSASGECISIQRLDSGMLHSYLWLHLTLHWVSEFPGKQSTLYICLQGLGRSLAGLWGVSKWSCVELNKHSKTSKPLVGASVQFHLCASQNNVQGVTFRICIRFSGCNPGECFCKPSLLWITDSLTERWRDQVLEVDQQRFSTLPLPIAEQETRESCIKFNI